MSTISGVSSASSAWSNVSAMRSQMQAKMFAKVDADSSGGVDKTELQSLLDDVAKKIGVSSSANVDALLKKLDADSNGTLSRDELAEGMKDIMPQPPATLNSTRSGSDSSSGDDLFGKVDTDGNGSVSQAEMQSLMDKMTSGSTSSSSTASSSSNDMFAKLDTNGDSSLSQAEFGPLICLINAS